MRRGFTPDCVLFDSLLEFAVCKCVPSEHVRVLVWRTLPPFIKGFSTSSDNGQAPSHEAVCSMVERWRPRPGFS